MALLFSFTSSVSLDTVRIRLIVLHDLELGRESSHGLFTNGFILAFVETARAFFLTMFTELEGYNSEAVITILIL
jgi:hypothetical protein